MRAIVICHGTHYTCDMAIARFSHKGLARFFSEGSAVGIHGPDVTDVDYEDYH